MTHATTTSSSQAEPSAGVPVLAVGRGDRVDVRPVIEYLRPFIVAAQATADVERRIPETLIVELERVGVFRAFLPREVGGLELHPTDEMELLYELGRIDAATAWAALGQNGGMMLPAPDVIEELRTAAGGRWITAGSHSTVGRAVVDGEGYRIYGQWHFASGLVSEDGLISQRLLGVEDIFGTAIPNSPEFVAAFERCFASLRDHGVTQTLQTLLKKPA